jgi:hypothetical protein
MTKKIKIDISILKRLEELKRQFDNIQEILTQDDDILKGEKGQSLDNNEKTVLDHMQKHPGSTKQETVDGLNGILSRVTIFETIKKLRGYDMIYLEKDKPNSQVHKLYVKDDSLIISLVHDLDVFEKEYFSLLKMLKERFKNEFNKFSEVDVQKKDKWVGFSLLFHMLTMYEDMIQIYLLHSLKTWPQKTRNNTELLRRLYTTLFSRLAGIQLKLLNSMPDRSPPFTSLPSLALNNFILRFYALPAHIQPDVLEYYKKYGLSMQLESVIDIMWEVSNDFFTLLYGNFTQYGVNKISDWRELLELKKRHPDLADKINSLHHPH